MIAILDKDTALDYSILGITEEVRYCVNRLHEVPEPATHAARYERSCHYGSPVLLCDIHAETVRQIARDENTFVCYVWPCRINVGRLVRIWKI